MEPAWTSDWVWGLPLIALTTMLHVLSLVGITLLLVRFQVRLEKRPMGQTSLALYAAAIFGALALALALLNGVEVGVWAAAYLLLAAIDTPADAMLYSINAITAYGSSGLDLAPHWKLMGALEATNGLLLFGISTAFLAAVITETWTAFRKIGG